MAGYWPSSFFACLWTETNRRSLNSPKNKKRNKAIIQPSRTNEIGSITDLLYGFLGSFFLPDTAGSSKGDVLYPTLFDDGLTSYFGLKSLSQKDTLDLRDV